MSLPTERTQVDGKGRIVIPSQMRKGLGIQIGDTIELFYYKNSLVVKKLTPEPMKTICIGCGKTEDEIEMTHKTTDNRFGICKNCYQQGLSFKEVSAK